MRGWALLLAPAVVCGAGLPLGSIVDDVKCAADASQSYALYLPSYFSADRLWPVILAFDPGARGRIPVERYEAAAEKYGYIVAGSKNSRNGSWRESAAAVEAMSADVAARFPIDQKRIYTAGMSGGARLAMGVALESGRIAGVFASSAGFPDAKPRKTLPFAVFGTAGTQDFNYLEMRRLDRELTSPHRVAIFEGAHVWLSSELAMEAVEWMEIQAMKSGIKPRAPGEIDAIFAKRADAAQDYAALDQLARDFEGLKNVAAIASRAAAMARDKSVREAQKKERREEAREQRYLDEILAAERLLLRDEHHAEAIRQLRDEWKELSDAANGRDDTPERRIARRVLRGLSMGAAERVPDPEYRRIVEQYRPPRQR